MLLIIINGERDKRSFKVPSSHDMLTPLQVITDLDPKQLECVDSLDWLAVKHHRRHADLQCSTDEHFSGLVDIDHHADVGRLLNQFINV